MSSKKNGKAGVVNGTGALTMDWKNSCTQELNSIAMKSSRHETLQPPLQVKANLRTKLTCCKHTDMECWRELTEQIKKWEAPGRLILSLKVRPRPQPLNPKASNQRRLYKLMLKLETLHTKSLTKITKSTNLNPIIWVHWYHPMLGAHKYLHLVEHSHPTIPCFPLPILDVTWHCTTRWGLEVLGQEFPTGRKMRMRKLIISDI